MPSPFVRLGDVVRQFGIEPDAVRLVSRRQNVHWRVRARGGEVYALRRFGVWAETPGDVEWEIGCVNALADAGLPVPRPIGGARRIGGATWLMAPWLRGRPLWRPSRDPPATDADYESLGERLAEFHAVAAALPGPPQRPAWSDCVSGAFPLSGGAERRALLLGELAKVAPDLAARLGQAAADLAARNLPRIFAGYRRQFVHGDFSPWNVRVRQGRLVGLLDFDLAHLDFRASDVAAARRGYHDGVVRGYLRVARLDAEELSSLEALWLGGSLRGVWWVLESRLAEGRMSAHGLQWNIEQLEKTRPYPA